MTTPAIRAALKRLVEALNDYDPKWDAFPEDAITAARAALAAVPEGEGEVDDGDVAIARWIESRPDWPNGWPAVTQCQLVALVGEALEHWSRPAAPLAPGHVNLIGFAFGREPWATWLKPGGCLESAHSELADLMLAVLARWGRPTTPPAPPEGEVGELISELRRICLDVAPCDAGTIEQAIARLQQQGQLSTTPPAPLEGEVGRLVEWLNAEADLRRNVLSTPTGLNLAQAARQADKLQSWANLIEAQAAARAALAAAPEGEGQTDAEIIAFWSEHCAGDGDAGIIRLARWGRPTTPPAPLEGEVGELVEFLDALAKSILTAAYTDKARRAATLLKQLSAAAPAVVPIPVSERLPVAEDCDAEGRCWIYGPWDPQLASPEWTLVSAKYALASYGVTHWLPAHALPLPAPQGGEVDG